MDLDAPDPRTGLFAILVVLWEGLALMVTVLQLLGALDVEGDRLTLLVGAAHSLLLLAAAALVRRGRTSGVWLAVVLLPVGFLAEAGRLRSVRPGDLAAFGLVLFVYGGLLRLLMRPEVLASCGFSAPPRWPRRATAPLPYLGVMLVAFQGGPPAIVAAAALVVLFLVVRRWRV